MAYAISDLLDVYNLWKSGKNNQISEFSVSFSSSSSSPLIFSGLSSVRDLCGKKVFSSEEIAYIHSLNKGGKLFFEDRFISFISDLRFDHHLSSIFEGNIFFPNQPILKVKGRRLIFPLVKKFMSFYLPRQIAVATFIEKIVTKIHPVPLVVYNSQRSYENCEDLDIRSAFLAGASSTEDFSSSLKYSIPMAAYQLNDAQRIHLNGENPINEIALLPPETDFILSGKVLDETLDGLAFHLKTFKAVCLDMADLEVPKIEIRFHNYQFSEILDKEFKIFRFSSKGLYAGDLLSRDAEMDDKKTIFGKYISSLDKERILFDHDEIAEDTLIDQKRRVVRVMRKLPCKYRFAFNDHSYPISIVKKCRTYESVDSLSKTRPA